MKNDRLNSIGKIVLAVLLLPAATTQAVVRYVAADGSGANGQSWLTAYNSIQAAINDAAMTAGGEVWVKQGSYTISAPITVNKAIKVYAGYSGSGSVRDPDVYPTTINGNRSVKHCFEVTANAQIDGFLITRGSAWGLVPRGGGMLITNCSATVSHCTFYRNEAVEWGGGIATISANGTTISDCEFVENTSSYYGGGGMYNYQSTLTITGCTFHANKAGTEELANGGGMLNEEGSPTIVNCMFTNNAAQYGAGLHNYHSNAHIEACTFADCNVATVGGGGLYNLGGAPTISKCLFQGNQVTHRGGAILDQSASRFVNCLLWDNSTIVYGGAVYVGRDMSEIGVSTAEFINCTISGNQASHGGGLYSYSAEAVLTNCVVWGNQAFLSRPGIYNHTALWPTQATASYSDIEDDAVYPGTGNILEDPLFVNAAGGDFHLPFDSPCVDAGSNGAITESQDYEGHPRVIDGDNRAGAVVDMGALEFQGRPDPIKSGELLQSVVYDGPSDTSAAYVFSLSVETDATVDYVEFQAPGGSTVYRVDGNLHPDGATVQKYHRVNGDTQIWEYRATYDTAGGLTAYGNGVYHIRAHSVNGSLQETQLSYYVPGTTNPVPEPKQRPEVTTWPAYNSTPYDHSGIVASPVIVFWTACTDASANSVYLAIVDRESREDLVMEVFDKSVTSGGPYTVSEGIRLAECAFAALYDGTASDGTPFLYGRTMTVRDQFEVPYANVYRFYSPVSGRHFYTIKETERDKLVNTYSYFWTYEGPVYNASASAYRAGAVPVYRFWSGQSHFYTINEAEKAKLINEFSHVWTFEGIVFYAFPEGTQPAECKPIYRFWKGADNAHFYTMDEAEKDKVISQYSNVYTFEGIAFYSYP